VAADLVVLIVLGRAAVPGAVEGPSLALGTAAALLVGYLGSFVARTLYLGRSVVAFEVAQTGGLLATGLGGAAYLASRSGAGTTPLGLGTLGLAAVVYAAAFAFVERRQQGSANFPFYASVALAFVLAGTWLALPDPARGPILAALALAAAALARLRARRTMVLHAAIYGVVAAVAGGLLAHARTTLLSSAAQVWPSPSWADLAVVTCLGLAAFLASHATARTTWAERAPCLLLDATVALSAAGLAAGWVAGLLGPPSPTADLGAIGTGRTAVLAAAAILTAWAGRWEAGREAGWLAWPMTALLGLKLLLEDFQRGRPATLILSLAFAGAALMLVPRLRASAPG
jgi:hypothetical protein